MDLAFDFDGTLTQRDTVLGFYRALCTSRRQFLARAAPVLAAMACTRTGLVSQEQVKRVGFRAFLRGRSRAELEDIGARYASGLRMHRAVVAQLDRHLADGHRVYVVSASWDVYVRAFRPGAVTLATSIRWESGRAASMGVHLQGPAKVDALRAAGVVALDEVWSDSDVDRPMARLARRAWKVDRTGAMRPWQVDP